MSFAADVLALIASYEKGGPWLLASWQRDTRLGARCALWAARSQRCSILASAMVWSRDDAFAAFHFHRMAPYGLIANLLAMPVISAVSMPAGLLALLAMPFGFDAPLWRLMGAPGSTGWTKVALWVSVAGRRSGGCRRSAIGWAAAGDRGRADHSEPAALTQPVAVPGAGPLGGGVPDRARPIARRPDGLRGVLDRATWSRCAARDGLLIFASGCAGADDLRRPATGLGFSGWRSGRRTDPDRLAADLLAHPTGCVALGWVDGNGGAEVIIGARPEWRTTAPGRR